MAKVDPTPAQRRVIETLDEPVFVAAGAGSGKTATLTRRLVWALSPGSGEGGAPYLESIDQALVITFTEKAAGEIKERVRSALRAAGLAEAALGVDSAWISTIHGMCARILRRHALELGLDPEFAVLGEHVAGELFSSALEGVLSEVARDPRCSELRQSVRAAAAGPHDRGSSIESMVRAIAEAAVSAPRGFDSISVPGELDLDAGMRQALVAYETLLGQPFRDDLLAEYAASRDALDAYLRTPPGSRDVPSALACMASLKAPVMNAGSKEASADARRAYVECLYDLLLASGRTRLDQVVDIARRVLDAYGELKGQACGLDNNDLLRLADDALRGHPRIAAEYSGRFRLVMVDEFQDTDAQQVDIVERLSGEGACHLATVGDAQQSIYRFRGADVSVFRAREREVGEGSVVRMDENFRSHDDILRFVGRTFSSGRLMGGFMDLSSNPSRPDGYRAREPRVSIEVVDGASRGGGGRRAPSAQERRARLADAVANRLAAMARQGARPGEMALLMGSLSHAGTYVEALRAHGLQSVVTGGSTFSEATEVRVVLAMLVYLADPADTTNGLFTLLTSSLFHLDADDLLSLATTTDAAHGVCARRRIDDGIAELATQGDAAYRPEAHVSGRARLATRVLAHAREALPTTEPADVCLLMAKESGWLWRLEDAGVEGHAQAANVLAAIEHVRALAAEGGLGPARLAGEFAAWLDVSKEAPATLSGDVVDAVRIMTVHASKGLEFPIVALVECFGSYRSQGGLVCLREDGGTSLSFLPPAPRIAGREVRVDVRGDLSASLAQDAEGARHPGYASCRERLLGRDREEDRGEMGRKLYVGLTRAREALVVGVQVPVRKTGEWADASSLGTAFLTELLGERGPGEGVSSLEYGGSAPARVERIHLEREADGTLSSGWSPEPVSFARGSLARPGRRGAGRRGVRHLCRRGARCRRARMEPSRGGVQLLVGMRRALDAPRAARTGAAPALARPPRARRAPRRPRGAPRRRRRGPRDAPRLGLPRARPDDGRDGPHARRRPRRCRRPAARPVPVRARAPRRGPREVGGLEPACLRPRPRGGGGRGALLLPGGVGPWALPRGCHRPAGLRSGLRPCPRRRLQDRGCGQRRRGACGRPCHAGALLRARAARPGLRARLVPLRVRRARRGGRPARCGALRVRCRRAPGAGLDVNRQDIVCT
jgi:ATP-dependent exoDNAse (exonuclease V) beta subunit